MVTDEPEVWFVAEVSVKTSSSGSFGARYEVIPLNPRTQPVKLLVVIPVYVNISLLILNKPYSFGNPLVLATSTVVADVVIPVERVVSPTTTSGVKLSNFKYWAKLSERSIGPPWYSWEIYIAWKNQQP